MSQEFEEGLAWAREVMGDPVATSVAASGMDVEVLMDILAAFGEPDE